MARDLSAQQGVDNTDGDYVNGKLVDGVNGTLVGEGINQDIVQYFQKLMDLAGLSPNGDPDNEVNGYQFITALEAVVRSYGATTSQKGTVEKATQTESDSGTADKFPDAAAIKNSLDAAIAGLESKFAEDWQAVSFASGFSSTGSNDVRYRRINNGTAVHIEGPYRRTGGSAGATVFTLPAGYRPTRLFQYGNAVTGNTSNCRISVNGLSGDFLDWDATTGFRYINMIIGIT